jgi:hypothetical protein
VSLFHPKTGDYHLATACRCKETTSFISIKKIRQLKLLQRVKNGKIKLTMEILTELEDDSDHNGYDGTLFRVIEATDIRYEIAIGSNWNADDNEQDDDSPEVLAHREEKSEETAEEADDSDEYVHIPSDRTSLEQPLSKSRRLGQQLCIDDRQRPEHNLHFTTRLCPQQNQLSPAN